MHANALSLSLSLCHSLTHKDKDGYAFMHRSLHPSAQHTAQHTFQHAKVLNHERRGRVRARVTAMVSIRQIFTEHCSGSYMNCIVDGVLAFKVRLAGSTARTANHRHTRLSSTITHHTAPYPPTDSSIRSLICRPNRTRTSTATSRPIITRSSRLPT